jgi:hypothetical protein
LDLFKPSDFQPISAKPVFSAGQVPVCLALGPESVSGPHLNRIGNVMVLAVGVDRHTAAKQVPIIDQNYPAWIEQGVEPPKRIQYRIM